MGNQITKEPIRETKKNAVQEVRNSNRTTVANVAKEPIRMGKENDFAPVLDKIIDISNKFTICFSNTPGPLKPLQYFDKNTGILT